MKRNAHGVLQDYKTASGTCTCLLACRKAASTLQHADDICIYVVSTHRAASGNGRMALTILYWVIGIIMQSLLLSRNMYAIISLTDLENDFINPFDLSARMNSWVTLEYAVEGSATALYLLGGKWVIGALQLGLLAYMVHLWTSKTIKIDTTDAFRQLPQQKRQRCALLIAHLVLFGTVLCRLVQAAVDGLLTPAGRVFAKQLLHEAAASVHGY